MSLLKCIVSFFCLITQTHSQLIYNDQKQNCTKPLLAGSYCYNGPKMDADSRLWKSCAVPGIVALTFDDGPGPYTEIILDILKQYNMKATFFLIGRNILKHPGIVQRMVDEEHQVGGHTQNHVPLQNIPAATVEKEMLGWEKTLNAFAFNGSLSDKKIPNYMRPPRGVVDDVSYPVLENLGYTPVHWSMLAGDSYGFSPSELFYALYIHFYNGSNVDMSKLSTIIQLHDTEVNISLVMPQLADYFNQTFMTQGVRFVTIEECLGLGIPSYRDNPRPFTSDPTCSNGLQQISNGINVCCDKDCGVCGGTNCSARPGGAQNCCVSNIINSNISCSQTTAPCILSN